MAQGKPKKTKTISISMDSDLLDKLDKFCEQDRRTRTSAMEIAVEQYLKSVGSLKGGKK